MEGVFYVFDVCRMSVTILIILPIDSLTYWNVKQGLRHWEMNQGLKTLILPKFTRKELYKAWRNGISTFLFFIFVLIVLIVDFVLAEALQYVKENQKFRCSPNSYLGTVQNLWGTLFFG